MIWQVPRIWENADVWILGGGPSVPKQFGIPDHITRQVIEGSLPPSAYSPYMSFLHDKHVIGINVAYMIGDWIDMLFFGDKGFFLTHQQGIANFKGIRVSCTPEMSNYTWVKYLARDTKKVKGISDNPKMVSWNHNSGSAAISVAANAGAKRIILLGFDMTLGSTKNQHWHDVYKRGQITTEKKIKALPFERHLRGFSAIAHDAKRRGIEIINASPDSAIVEFRKVSVRELIEQEVLV